MQLSVWSQVLWVSGFALNLALLAVLLVKKRYRTLPWFTILIGQDVLQIIVLFTVHHFGSLLAYEYAYYSGEAIDAILHLLVIWEVARILIGRHLGLRLYDEIFSHWVGFLLMAAVVIYFVTSPVGPALRLSAVVALRAGQVSTIGVAGLLLMVLGLTFFYRVKVRVHAQAIVYGLALYSSGKFILQGAMLFFGSAILPQANDWLRPVYHIALLLWIVCLWREEPERALSDEMYTMVRQGRAGINPPMPKSVIEEQAQRPRRLVFFLRERKRTPEVLSGPESAEIGS